MHINMLYSTTEKKQKWQFLFEALMKQQQDKKAKKEAKKELDKNYLQGKWKVSMFLKIPYKNKIKKPCWYIGALQRNHLIHKMGRSKFKLFC